MDLFPVTDAERLMHCEDGIIKHLVALARCVRDCIVWGTYPGGRSNGRK